MYLKLVSEFPERNLPLLASGIIHTAQTKNIGGAAGVDMNGWKVLKQILQRRVPLLCWDEGTGKF